jgi:hypothetical protein
MRRRRAQRSVRAHHASLAGARRGPGLKARNTDATSRKATTRLRTTMLLAATFACVIAVFPVRAQEGLTMTEKEKLVANFAVQLGVGLHPQSQHMPGGHPATASAVNLPAAAGVAAVVFGAAANSAVSTLLDKQAAKGQVRADGTVIGGKLDKAILLGAVQALIASPWGGPAAFGAAVTTAAGVPMGSWIDDQFPGSDRATVVKRAAAQGVGNAALAGCTLAAMKFVGLSTLSGPGCIPVIAVIGTGAAINSLVASGIDAKNAGPPPPPNLLPISTLPPPQVAAVPPNEAPPPADAPTPTPAPTAGPTLAPAPTPSAEPARPLPAGDPNSASNGPFTGPLNADLSRGPPQYGDGLVGPPAPRDRTAAATPSGPAVQPRGGQAPAPQPSGQPPEPQAGQPPFTPPSAQTPQRPPQGGQPAPPQQGQQPAPQAGQTPPRPPQGAQTPPPGQAGQAPSQQSGQRPQPSPPGQVAGLPPGAPAARPPGSQPGATTPPQSTTPTPALKPGERFGEVCFIQRYAGESADKKTCQPPRVLKPGEPTLLRCGPDQGLALGCVDAEKVDLDCDSAKAKQEGVCLLEPKARTAAPAAPLPPPTLPPSALPKSAPPTTNLRAEVAPALLPPPTLPKTALAPPLPPPVIAPPVAHAPALLPPPILPTPKPPVTHAPPPSAAAPALLPPPILQPPAPPPPAPPSVAHAPAAAVPAPPPAPAPEPLPPVAVDPTDDDLPFDVAALLPPMTIDPDEDDDPPPARHGQRRQRHVDPAPRERSAAPPVRSASHPPQRHVTIYIPPPRVIPHAPRPPHVNIHRPVVRTTPPVARVPHINVHRPAMQPHGRHRR